MSESRIGINPEMPRGFEKLDGLEVVNLENRSIRYNAIIELGEGGSAFERKVLLPDLAEMWGYDPKEYENYNANPEMWELRQLVKQFETRIYGMEEAVQQRDQRIQTLETRIENLENSQSTTEPIASPEPEPTPTPIEPEPAPAPQPSPEPSPTPKPVPTPEAVDDLPQPRRNVLGRSRNAALASIAYLFARRINTTYEYDEEGRVTREVREEPRRGIGAIGATALAGAALLVGWLIWSRHTGHDPSQAVLLHQEHVTQDKLTALTNNLNHFEAQSHAENVHAHAHDLRAIHGLHNQIARDHAQEMRTIHGLQIQLHEAGAHDAMSGAGAHSTTASEHISAAANHSESLGYKGDTIWSDVSKLLSSKLGRSPTNSELSRATAHVLKVNDLSWAKVRHLPVGYHYEIPGNLVAVAKG